MMTRKPIPHKSLWRAVVFGLLLMASMMSCTLLQGQGAEESTSSDQLFHWHREGGFAGFCDDVTVYATHSVVVSSCRSQPAETVGELTLKPDEQAALDKWLDTYDTSTYEQSDPATADAMTITMEIYGVGQKTPDETAWQTMSTFAQQVIVRVRP